MLGIAYYPGEQLTLSSDDDTCRTADGCQHQEDCERNEFVHHFSLGTVPPAVKTQESIFDKLMFCDILEQQHNYCSAGGQTMRRMFSAVGIVLIALALVPASAETLSIYEEARQASQQVTETTKQIKDLAASGQIDEALALLNIYDQNPLAPEGADARLALAKACRSAKRFSEAAALLKKTAAEDPYNRVAPESLGLLATILYYDLKDSTSYNDYLTRLAVEYYPGIPIVAQARAAFGGNLQDAPVSQKILLDETLGESSIFTRSYLGSSNFCQWDVIRTLGEGGFVVHDNGLQPGSKLSLSIMNQYGLVIMNGGDSSGKSFPEASIEEIVNYVRGGGRLLVVSASITLGIGKMPQYYSPLMSRFGLEFDEGYTTGNSTVKCKPASHPAMKDTDQFRATFGIRVTGGTPIGYYGSDPIISMVKFGKGTVVAAGIGTGFQGNTIGNLYRTTEAKKAEARINRTFLLQLVRNLLSTQPDSRNSRSVKPFESVSR